MGQPYVHQAILSLRPGCDVAAPGGAVTVALCGHWEHEGRCRWPHHSNLQPASGSAVLRTVFVSDPLEEQQVRAAIDTRLEVGALTADGRTSRWDLRETHAVDPDGDEAVLGAQLASRHR